MVSIFKKIFNFLPDRGYRKRRWEDDGLNTPGLDQYSYKIPRRSLHRDESIPTTPLSSLHSRDRMAEQENPKGKQPKQISTVFVKAPSRKKENVTDSSSDVMIHYESLSSTQGIPCSSRLPLTSKQHDEIIIDYDSTKQHPQPSTSQQSSSAGFEMCSHWIKPKTRPGNRLISSVSRPMFNAKAPIFQKRLTCNPFINSPPRNSALKSCYKLEDKKKYAKLLTDFMSDRNFHFLSRGKPKSREVTSSSRRPSKEIIELIDLTQTEDKSDIGKTIKTYHIDRTTEKSISKCILKETAIDDVLLKEESHFPNKNSLAADLKKNALLGPSYIDNLVQSFKKSAEERALETKKTRESLEILKAKGKEQFDDKYLERISKQVQLFEISKEEEEIEEIVEEEELPPLTAEAEAMINKALLPTPRTEVLVSAFNRDITRHDISTLNGLNWLNDEVINFYMELIAERGKLDNYPSVYAFNTFFFPKVCNMGHSSVKRWTKKEDIFKYEMLLVPVHLGVHWCMIIMDMTNKTITYYDSMLGKEVGLKHMLQYLVAEKKDKKNEVLDTSDWKLVKAMDIPQQMNGCDCGVFSCMFAETLSRRKKISFTQQHMPYFRRRMVYEIITKKLIM